MSAGPDDTATHRRGRRWRTLAVIVAGALVSVSLAASTPAARATESPNLLIGDHGTFDHSTGGWAGSSASLSTVGSPTQAGPGSLAVTTTATGPANAGATSGNGPTTWTPAVGGQVYSGSVWAQAASTGRSVASVLGFISTSGSVTNAVWGQSTPDNATGWTQTPPVVGIAPSGTAFVELTVIIYGTAQGDTHYLDTASLTTHSSGSANVSGPLHTSGNAIYDSTNAPVRLRGVTDDWLDYNSSIYAGSYLDDSSVAAMKQWGANVVRVLLSEDYWNPNDCLYAPGYTAAVDQAVQSITSRGMVAMLDLHNNNRGTGSCDASNQQRMADSPGSINFWTSVASRYASNPLVAFDLYNEPHDITWTQWLDGGTLTDPDGVTWQAAGMQQLYDAVRSTGAQNLVFASGNDWGSTPPSGSSLLSGSNVVYAAHYYTCPHTPPPSCTTPNPSDPTPVLDEWNQLSTSAPVMVTEFGWPDPSSGTYTQNVINWAESKGVGWTPFDWSQGGAAGTTSSFGFLADLSVFEPAASGMPVLSALAANAANAPPAVAAVSPGSGPAAGGTTVTVTGTGFSDVAGSTALDFGSAAASNVSCSSTTSCTATAPPGSGTVDVTVTVDGATSLKSPADQFTYGPPGPYHPLTPYRVADTRAASGEPYAGQTLGPSTSLDFQVSGTVGGQGQSVPSDATAVVLNVTATDPSQAGYLTVWPSGAPRPVVSNLNFSPHQSVPNLVEVALGQGGRVSVYNPAGSTDVVVDVEGYAGPPSAAGTGLFTPLSPARIVDTRTSSGEPYAGRTLAPNSSLSVQVTGTGGVPASGVAAVVLNLTATDTSAQGYLTAWPTGAPRPLASNLNFVAGQTVPNRVIVPVGTGGQVSIYNPSGSTDVVADVGGYFSDSSNPLASGAQLSAAAPTRIADTRAGSGEPDAGKTLTPGGVLKVQVSGVGGVPAMSSSSPPVAAVLNVTATDTTAPSYLTAWPDGEPRPLASDLNWVQGQTVPDLVIVQLGPNGEVDLYNAAGSTDAVVDVMGWYS